MPKPVPRRVALLGLTDKERLQIARCVFFAGSAPGSGTGYVPAERLDAAELLIADAADAPSVQLVMATDRLAATLFIGTTPPPGALACLSRPLEAALVLREQGFLSAAPRALAAARLQKVAASPWKGASRPRTQGWPPLQATALLVSHAVGADAAAPSDPGATAATVTAAATDGAGALKPLLQAAGVTVESVHSAHDALERLALRHFDLIFVDAALDAGSRVDALALCQRIRRAPLAARTLGSRLVLLSPQGSQVDRVRATLAGCDDCLALPAEAGALQALLLPLRAPLAAPPGHRPTHAAGADAAGTRQPAKPGA